MAVSPQRMPADFLKPYVAHWMPVFLSPMLLPIPIVLHWNCNGLIVLCRILAQTVLLHSVSWKGRPHTNYLRIPSPGRKFSSTQWDNEYIQTTFSSSCFSS